MTYQSSLPELEIIPDGGSFDRPSFMKHKTPDKSFEKTPTRAGQSYRSPIVDITYPKRRLFQQRVSPQKEFPEDDHDYGQLEDSGNYLGTIELNTLPNDEIVQIGDRMSDKKQRNIPFSTLVVDDLPQEKIIQEDWQQKEKQTITHLQDQVLKKSNKQGESNVEKTLKGYQIYKDYNCMLNLTDITYGERGNNKFYQIQILHKELNNFTVFTKWGRIGAKNPQSQLKEVESRFDAIQQFKKLFAHKTQQQWDDRDKFVQQSGKYNLKGVTQAGQSDSVNDDVDRLNKRNTILSQKIKNNTSKLQQDVKELMASIYDIEQMKRTLKELNIDTEKNPLGRLSGDQITKGYKVLKEIQNQLKNEKCKGMVLAELSNLFYTNIPQNYGMRKPPTIDTFDRLREKVRLLDILRELDVANRQMDIATNDKVYKLFKHIQQNKDTNPLDLFYELLKCDIQLTQDLEMHDAIKNAVSSTHGPTHDFRLQVLKIFEVQRREEQFRYYPFNKFTNKRLLWHGSRTNNYVGILSEGLRVAPPDAPSSGYMFGKGVYFTDVCSKAAQYCQQSSENPEGLLLLCEVALGNMYKVFKAKSFAQAPHRYHSVHGVGRNLCDVQRQMKLQNDVSFEMGSIVVNEDLKVQNIESELVYNEYIVYDVAQIRIKYIIKVRFSKTQGVL